ncbi:helix-turn-helix transcriptional regulator [Nocardioides sp. NPDC058538]|uniref:helix-turn-helix transcriptional regulator n=1 Tax=Nocardioides sp. NPDC058538 TaxID=3346542 RepID=UPI00364C0600
MTVTTASLPDGKDDDILTLSEVSEILKVPVNTLRWWRQLGTGPKYTKFGRRLVTTLGEVKRWLAEQKRNGGIA